MVAATIKNSIKGKDLATRIGCEEFAIVLPETLYRSKNRGRNRVTGPDPN